MKYLVTFLPVFLLISINISYAQRQPAVDFGNSSQTVQMVEFSKDGSQLIAGGFLKIWDINNNEKPYYNFHDKKTLAAYDVVQNADISEDGRYVATVVIGHLNVYDIKLQREIKDIGKGSPVCVAFGPDNQLAYALTNGKLNVYNVVTGENTFIGEFKVGKYTRVAWSPSGRYIAFGGKENNIILLDRDDEVEISVPGTEKKLVSDLEFSPDNQYLVIAGRGTGNIRIFNIANREDQLWVGHPGGTWTLDFHPGGKYLATGGWDKNIYIWKFPEGKRVSTWPAHKRTVTAVSFSPDGNMIASGCLNTPLLGVDDTRIWTLDDDLKAQILADQQLGERENIEQLKNQNYVVPESVEQNLSAEVLTEQKRLALLIGNGNYQNGGILANPENDANDIAARLQSLGFDVMLYNNLDQSGFKKAIDDFGARLASYDIGLFYYAGHGIQVKGNNYLIPVDANLRSENDVEYDCVNAGRLLAKMEDAGSTTNIIILDACRDNPFERSWRRSTHGSGLAFMTAPAGSLISYATSPGATASDGSGRNGLFTSALLNYMDEPNLSVLEMFQKVRTYVRENSDGEQVPWESTSLEGNFYFKINE